jgi:hypothetical protein
MADIIWHVRCGWVITGNFTALEGNAVMSFLYREIKANCLEFETLTSINMKNVLLECM